MCSDLNWPVPLQDMQFRLARVDSMFLHSQTPKAKHRHWPKMGTGEALMQLGRGRGLSFLCGIRDCFMERGAFEGEKV